jgi:hypothetical protein
MMNEIALVLSSLGVGGLLGAFAKSILDKRQLKFSKVFDYKERRYQAITILMWVAMNPSEHEFTMLKRRRPELADTDGLDRELQLEYYNMMTYASNKVLTNFKAFLDNKSLANWQAVAKAMKKDLYL